MKSPVQLIHRLRIKWPMAFWLAFVTLCLWLGQSGDFLRTTPEYLSQTPIENPYFYSFEKDGVRSYVLGTFHVGVRLRQFPSNVSHALENANVFVAEDLDNDTIEPDMSKVQKFEMGLLKEKTIQAFHRRGIKIENFSTKTTVLTPCMLYTFWDARPEWHRLDKELENQARSKHKKLLALDSSARLSEALLRVSKECDLNKIVERTAPEAARQSFLESLQAYIGGIESDMRSSTTASEMMLVEARNQDWLPKIESVHRQGAFVAVGVLHLFGENGLLKRLERAGYKVLRVPSDSSKSRVSQRYTGL